MTGRPTRRSRLSLCCPPRTASRRQPVTLRIANVDRRVVQEIRAIPGDRVSCTAMVVMRSTPDQVEAGPFEFSLLDASYDAIVVEGTIGYEDILNAPFPGKAVTPASVPGIF